MPRCGPYVFTIDGRRPMTVHHIKARLDRESRIKDWRLHDLRRTLRSGLAELGVSYEIAERVIGHAAPQLERTYNVFSYREEKRSALERWPRHLALIVMDGDAAPNVGGVARPDISLGRLGKADRPLTGPPPSSET
jgi:hypothetical protein